MCLKDVFKNTFANNVTVINNTNFNIRYLNCSIFCAYMQSYDILLWYRHLHLSYGSPAGLYRIIPLLLSRSIHQYAVILGINNFRDLST